MRTSSTLSLVLFVLSVTMTALGQPVPAEEEALQGVMFYVSKLGDNTDGLSWRTAFTTLQAALDAVPDDKGGHTIVVRPDTYMEANLAPAHPGAAGAYNTLVGDWDGGLGSGASGWAVIDSGDPTKGFKSYDWWSTIRATQQGWSEEHKDATFSAICWDRWQLRRLYATGADAGLFWDCTNRVEPFTVVVEDCVSIGRAFGAGVASCLSRTDEPIVFRRCGLWALDWWGDTAAAYVRVENESMPDRPDVYFEDCVMASPQCALKGGNFGFHTYTRAKATRCNMVVLNFSQPVGTPSDGIIVSVQNGKYFHVDLEDSTVMGYKVFGVKVDTDSVNALGFTTTGDVKAYVQFTQPVPEGFYRLTHWPTDLFASMAPPALTAAGPVLERRETVIRDLCEVSHVHWQGRLCRMECIRPGQGGTQADYYLLLRDAETGAEIARFAEGYGLASAFVHEDTFYAFASRWEEGNWNDVTCFSSRDLKAWESTVAIVQENEHLFNSSVCRGPEGFAMAYESNDPAYPAFTTKFAVSPDLKTWTKVPEATFGTNRYTACPFITHANGFYYVLYLERREPRWFFETYITRSKDLKGWERSAANPVLSPAALGEGINVSDPDLIEHDGKTRLYYAAGDQLTWMNILWAEYNGPLSRFLESWYAAPGIPDGGAVTVSP
ncbi:MAG: hypothetical protein GXY07_04260 [Candidatus Hydrogenedentes bacterium]|nr:hypothetical protein [Candidatus Hydrogenedentota bacterium]